MIKNLPRQLNEAGKIKIGKKGAMITSAKGKEFRPPKKLDHFQLVTTEKDQNGDYVIDIDLQNKIKASGSGLQNENGCLVGLPIRLLYDDTELNFPHRYVSYVSGQLSCHGDGEVSHKRIDNFEKDHLCPCDRVMPGYDKDDKCKPTGTLTCVIDEAELFGQAHKFRTTSMNTIKGILGGIELIKTATNGKIAGLPLMLTMNSKQTTTPQGVSTTVYIVSICYRGSMTDLRDEVLKIMSTEKQYLLSMDTMEAKAKQCVLDLDPEEEKDFVEEFFPDSIKTDAVKENSVVEKNNAQIDGGNIVAGTIEKGKPEGAEEEIDDVAVEVEGALEPVGQYRKVYESFIAEKDVEKAMSFARRLQKGNLIYWLVNTYPDIDFESNIKKPELLELVENVLTSTLPEVEKTNTDELSKQEEIKEDEVEKKEKPVEFPSEWDDSGPIQKEQLRELVRLKTFLEGEGILRPDKWVDHVKYFTDANGKPIEKAVNLTTKQGESFITMLGNNIV